MEKFQNWLKKYRWTLLVIIIVVLLYLRINADSSYTPPVYGAVYINECKQLILGQIKSPSTAIFSDITFIDGGVKFIQWTLDSQNWFWAMMRWTFTCKKAQGENMIVNILER
jgi:hypothetical protein